jgi:hypothetical protein
MATSEPKQETYVGRIARLAGEHPKRAARLGRHRALFRIVGCVGAISGASR